MFSLKESVDFFGKAVSLGFLFELVDDPDDNSPYRAYVKAVDVWAYASSVEQQDLAYTLANIMGSGHCIRNVTKSTPPELRRWSVPTFGQDGYLHVFAVPTPEWSSLYQPRRYKPISVKSGQRYNFAVSVPPLSVASGPSAPIAKPGGLIL